MIFTELNFFIFFGLFFPIYYVLRNRIHTRNFLTLIASYIFYGWWDPRFLGLIIISSSLDYLCGRLLVKKGVFGRWPLYASAVGNLSILVCFKYYGFFVDSFNANILANLGLPPSEALNIILPIGISFYTFQSMSYTIDVYRGRIDPEKNLITFFCYVAFFPQLVAGPIERAERLLPQFRQPVTISQKDVLYGLRLFIWGFFFKVVIADTAAIYTDAAFTEPMEYGWTVILGTLSFTIQIYCDFMGYSLMAKGIAGILGINLMTNFLFPYWSLSIQEFWRRWHISLSSWIRDYVYATLGGNQCGLIRTIFNLGITMLLAGLWHGAGWTFVIWGALHGLALAIHRTYSFLSCPPLPSWLSWAMTMTVVVCGWFVFRVEHYEQAVSALASMSDMTWTIGHQSTLGALAALMSVLILTEIASRRSNDIVPNFSKLSTEALFLAAIMLVSIASFDRHAPKFIYFQF